MIRTTAPTKDNANYDWGATTKGQCTWYCYGRAYEEFKAYPTYWDRATRTGKYPNAKNWLDNYREPWQPKGTDYQPVAKDIIVFNGSYGHVAFIEKMNGDGTALVSQYNLDTMEGFSTATWTIGSNLVGKYARTGAVKGYLHYDKKDVDYKTMYENLLKDMKSIRKVADKYE